MAAWGEARFVAVGRIGGRLDRATGGCGVVGRAPDERRDIVAAAGGPVCRAAGECGADDERADEHHGPPRVPDEAADLGEPRDRRQSL